jgi:hypothetical protein
MNWRLGVVALCGLTIIAALGCLTACRGNKDSLPVAHEIGIRARSPERHPDGTAPAVMDDDALIRELARYGVEVSKPAAAEQAYTFLMPAPKTADEPGAVSSANIAGYTHDLADLLRQVKQLHAEGKLPGPNGDVAPAR